VSDGLTFLSRKHSRASRRWKGVRDFKLYCAGWLLWNSLPWIPRPWNSLPWIPRPWISLPWNPRPWNRYWHLLSVFYSSCSVQRCLIFAASRCRATILLFVLCYTFLISRGKGPQEELLFLGLNYPSMESDTAAYWCSVHARRRQGGFGLIRHSVEVAVPVLAENGVQSSLPTTVEGLSPETKSASPWTRTEQQP
jgi:hypothetical protein